MRPNRNTSSKTNEKGQHQPFSFGLLIGSLVGLVIYYLYGTPSGKKVSKLIEKEYRHQQSQADTNDPLQKKLKSWRTGIHSLQAKINRYLKVEKDKPAPPPKSTPAKPSRRYFKQHA